MTQEASSTTTAKAPNSHPFETDSRPWVRWWWLRGPFREEDIDGQLRWLRDHRFGGVELAFLCPLWSGLDAGAAELPAWLGEEFSRLLEITKRRADELGLGCDFTFGSCWPFGGTCVDAVEASRTLSGLSGQRLAGSWEEPERGFIVNHLYSHALRSYARALAPAFSAGVRGSTSALFCDSWEIAKHDLWTPELWKIFEQRFGYDLQEVSDRVASDPQIRYDHRKLIGEAVVREFYATFTEICHELGARSRVQCHGSPSDLLSAYAAVDIPETEAILFPPHFSRIPASAAALAGKPVLSSETFTCIYGFPSYRDPTALLLRRKEQVADLKMLADALFAQGVNQIVWHGMPYNPPDEPNRSEFYASVHVGPDCAFRDELPAFNAYLEHVSSVLKRGRTESRVAVYLPNEDEIIRGELPPELRVPGSQDHWELRYVTIPSETEGYAPLWISAPFLRRATVVDGEIRCGAQRFQALWVDVEWIDYDALEAMVELANAGAAVVLRRRPRQPGYRPRPGYERLVAALGNLAAGDLSSTPARPLLQGERLPYFWVRRDDGVTWMFLAHPASRDLAYPMRHGQSRGARAETIRLEVDAEGYKRVKLRFKARQSLLVRVEGPRVDVLEPGYKPPRPRSEA